MESGGPQPPMTDDELPDYVCCVVTESVWTWFLTIILSVLLFALATLRYCKRYLGSEQFASKNQHLLARQLVRTTWLVENEWFTQVVSYGLFALIFMHICTDEEDSSNVS